MLIADCYRSNVLANPQLTALTRMPIAGLLAWVIPGLGHIYLGHRTRGLVCLVTITVTFWTGVAIGGVRDIVDPKERTLWFIAQFLNAGNTAVGYALGHRFQTGSTPAAGESRDDPPPVPAHWASADVGVHYTGVAGLLNLLVIFDAIARAEPSLATKRKKRKPQGGVP